MSTARIDSPEKGELRWGVDERKNPPANRHVSDVRPEYVMLGLLMHRSMHGYDLFTQFQASLGRVWRISQSQMYAILKRLEAQGLIQGLMEEREKSPSRRYLAITPAGLSRFSAWLMSPSDCSSRVLRLEFISRLFFAGMQGEGLPAIIVEDQAALLRRQLANHEAILKGLKEDEVFNRLGVDFRVHQLRAELAWLEEAVLPLLPAKPV